MRLHCALTIPPPQHTPGTSWRSCFACRSRTPSSSRCSCSWRGPWQASRHTRLRTCPRGSRRPSNSCGPRRPTTCVHTSHAVLRGGTVCGIRRVGATIVVGDRAAFTSSRLAQNVLRRRAGVLVQSDIAEHQRREAARLTCTLSDLKAAATADRQLLAQRTQALAALQVIQALCRTGATTAGGGGR